MANRENPDTVPKGSPGSGEDICRKCSGSGKVAGEACPDCKGTGKVTVGIGGG